LSSPDNQLIENLETYKDLFDHAHDLIHIVYPDGTILYVNKAWEKHLAYKQEEVQGRSIYSIVVPEDREAFMRYRQEVIKGISQDKQVVVSLQSRSGETVTVEGFVSVRMNAGKALYTRGIFRDISVRIRNERQLQQLNELLQERESNLQQLLTHAPDAIIVVDEESRIIYWNPKAVAVFGWTEEEAFGKKLGDTIIPPQYREAHNRGMSRYLTTGEAHVLNQTLELSALNKKGTEFYISLTISATRQHGRPAFIAFIRDIDREKRIELELEKKRELLERSNRELEQFAYVASHDLQEPLRKILFYTNRVLEANGLTEGSKTHIEKVSESAQRMKGLISNLLDFSRLSQSNLFFEEVNLNTVVSGVLTDFELLIKQKGGVVEVDPLPTLEAIPLQMHQLLFNLIGNGLKFSRRHVRPVIKIAGNKVSRERKLAFPQLITTNDYYEIRVSDNGIGFNQEYAEKIFTIFQRLNQRSQYEGYGIGLAVCQKIIENHNGIIWAEGQPQKGATFGFILPCKQNKSSAKA
jgi:two-component system, LuxR family, sensor kinase FixL